MPIDSRDTKGTIRQYIGVSSLKGANPKSLRLLSGLPRSSELTENSVRDYHRMTKTSELMLDQDNPAIRWDVGIVPSAGYMSP